MLREQNLLPDIASADGNTGSTADEIEQRSTELGCSRRNRHVSVNRFLRKPINGCLSRRAERALSAAPHSVLHFAHLIQRR
jgi:hypothetical protein